MAFPSVHWLLQIVFIRHSKILTLMQMIVFNASEPVTTWCKEISINETQGCFNHILLLHLAIVLCLIVLTYFYYLLMPSCCVIFEVRVIVRSCFFTSCFGHITCNWGGCYVSPICVSSKLFSCFNDSIPMAVLVPPD